MKEKLTTAPILRSPSTSDSFILETDASDLGIGCCLKASSGNGEEFIVGYDSANLSDTEYQWNIFEKEAFSIIEATEKLRHYLIGKKFILRTDSRILTYLQSKHTSKSRKLLNWALKLSEFDFDIVHVESKNNAISDCLTRLYHINAIFQLQPKFSMNDILIAQQNDTFISNAKEYLQTGKAYFGVSKLGPLKRHRKQLHQSEHSVLR